MRYSVVLLPEEDGRYTVTVPVLPGCVTYGSTVAQALERARDAIQQYVASLEAHGEPVPVEPAPAQLALVDV
jgi:predicted RNase H-like HicB family nuclease